MRLAALYRHPVKSLGSEAVSEIALSPGRAAPHDRAYALAHGASAFDPAAPAWAACSNFLRIANAPALAAVRIAYEPETRRLNASHEAADAISAVLDDADDAQRLADWAAALAAKNGAYAGPYRIAAAPDRALTDADAEAVSIMSMASLRALSDRVGAPLDARRFRGNLWLDRADAPLAPWEELDWPGRILTIGAVTLRVLEPIVRCAATAANPDTGRRDASPTRTLSALFGDPLFGVLAEVVDGGVVRLDDSARLG